MNDAALRLKIPREAVEPRFLRYFEAIDAAAPPALDPSDGAKAVEHGMLELDDEARFFPLQLNAEVSMMLTAVIVIAAVLVGGAASIILLGVELDPVKAGFIGLGIAGGLGTAGVKLASTRQGQDTTTHMGVLITPDHLVIRGPSTVHIIARTAIETIDENMWEEPPRSKHDKPWTHYEARVLVEADERQHVVPLIAVQAHGELGLSLRAGHPEGRFVSELVKYLVRKWLRADATSP